MGMDIYVQKLSDPLQEWTLNVDASDTIEGVKTRLVFEELPTVFDHLKVRLFKDSVELMNGSTLSDYNVQKFNHLTSSYDSSDCNPIFDKFAYREEDGCQRFKRLRHLGYL